MGSTMVRILTGTAWAALLALTLLWWAPSLLLTVTGLLLDRLRFVLTMVLVDVLRGFGRQDVALRVCEAARRRCDARLQALNARRR